MENFESKVVLITGGGTGIGKATAAAFIANGAKVIITGRRQAVLEQTAQKLGPQADFITGDVSKNGEPARIVEETIRRLGRLDVLVNNAGSGNMAPLSATRDEDIEAMYRTNVFAPLAMIREATTHLASSKGAIVNISSTMSHGVMAGAAAYGSSKAAVDHATRQIAAELGPMGIRANAVAPGFTITDISAGVQSDEQMMGMIVAQTPMGRPGQPEDIANAVLLLADNRARWITGQIVQASGGLML